MSGRWGVRGWGRVEPVVQSDLCPRRKAPLAKRRMGPGATIFKIGLHIARGPFILLNDTCASLGATHLLLRDRRPRGALCVGVTSAPWLDGRSDPPQGAAILSFCRSPLLGPTYAVIFKTRRLGNKSKHTHTHTHTHT